MNQFSKSLSAYEPANYPEQWLLSDEERLAEKQAFIKAHAEYAAFSDRKWREKKSA